MHTALEDIRRYIEANLKPDRYTHSLKVMETAEKLAVRYGVDTKEASLAGLLHDCGKHLSKDELITLLEKDGQILTFAEKAEPILLHGRAGAILAKERFGIANEAVLSAIATHTTGKVGMTMLGRIIYVADFIEPGRRGNWVEKLRVAAFNDLDACLVLCADCTITQLIKEGKLIHTDTIEMRNELLALATKKL